MEKFPGILVPASREEFEDWIERNSGGFVISRRSKNQAMIHLGRCGHFKHSDESASLTANSKVCSTDRRKLEAWWAGESSARLRLCRDCM